MKLASEDSAPRMIRNGSTTTAPNPDYSRTPSNTLTRALSHRGRGAHFWIPSPGDPLLFPMQRVTGEGQGEGAAARHEASSRIIRVKGVLSRALAARA